MWNRNAQLKRNTSRSDLRLKKMCGNNFKLTRNISNSTSYHPSKLGHVFLFVLKFQTTRRYILKRYILEHHYNHLHRASCALSKTIEGLYQDMSYVTFSAVLFGMFQSSGVSFSKMALFLHIRHSIYATIQHTVSIPKR